MYTWLYLSLTPFSRVSFFSKFLPAKSFSFLLTLGFCKAPTDNPDCNRCYINKVTLNWLKSSNAYRTVSSLCYMWFYFFPSMHCTRQHSLSVCVPFVHTLPLQASPPAGLEARVQVRAAVLRTLQHLLTQEKDGDPESRASGPKSSGRTGKKNKKRQQRGKHVKWRIKKNRVHRAAFLPHTKSLNLHPTEMPPTRNWEIK